MEIERRFQELEVRMLHQRRMLISGLLVAIITSLIPLVLGADSKGQSKQASTVRTGALVLEDTTGKPVAMFTVDDKGNPLLCLGIDKSKPQVCFGVLNGEPQVLVSGGRQRPSVQLEVMRDGTAAVRVVGKADREQ